MKPRDVVEQVRRINVMSSSGRLGRFSDKFITPLLESLHSDWLLSRGQLGTPLAALSTPRPLGSPSWGGHLEFRNRIHPLSYLPLRCSVAWPVKQALNLQFCKILNTFPFRSFLSGSYSVSSRSGDTTTANIPGDLARLPSKE
jgi:hypothetical protein